MSGRNAAYVAAAANAVPTLIALVRQLQAENAELREWKRLAEKDALIERIAEIALQQCADYPDIETRTPYERLWAIEQTLIGTSAACDDLHKWIRTREPDPEKFADEMIALQNAENAELRREK